MKRILLCTLFFAATSWLPGQGKKPVIHSLADLNQGYDHSAEHEITVFVEGAVEHPGSYKLKASDNLRKAFETAGSFTALALKNQIRLERVLPDGARLSTGVSAERGDERWSVILLCDGDHLVVPQDDPLGVENFVKVTVVSEHSFFIRDGHVRFQPDLMISDLGVGELRIPSRDGSSKSEAVFVKVETVEAGGKVCEVVPTSRSPSEMKEQEILHPGDIRLFGAPSGYDLKIDGPGKYEITVSVAFGKKSDWRKFFWVKAEKFEIEALAEKAD